MRKCCKFEYFITNQHTNICHRLRWSNVTYPMKMSLSRLSCHTGVVCIKLQYTERERYFAGLASPIKLQPMNQIHPPLAFLLAAETILFSYSVLAWGVMYSLDNIARSVKIVGLFAYLIMIYRQNK